MTGEWLAFGFAFTVMALMTMTQIGIPPHRYSGHYRGWIETYWTPMQEMLRDGHLSKKTLARVTIDREQRIKAGRFRRTISKAS